MKSYRAQAEAQAEVQAEVQVSEVEVYAQNELRMARLEQYPCAVLRVL